MRQLFHERSIRVRGEVNPFDREILTPKALYFISLLMKRFARQRRSLLQQRKEAQERIDAGALPDFLPETEHLRNAGWAIDPIPAELQRRWVEITGPASNRKMVINALNSGADVYMADAEDSESPTWKNIIQGQLNVRDAVFGTIRFTAAGGKEYSLAEQRAVLMFRPRGLHLLERHVLVDEEPVPASFFDFGLFICHNALALYERGSAPYLYLPKLEHHLEARLWNELFTFAEEYHNLPAGTIKATVLIETIPAAFQMEEILYELRTHITGLNCGRWDYIFSFIKKFSARPEFVLPDRQTITMERHFLSSYVTLLIRTCHRRGAYAMGGMAAQIPIKDNPEAHAEALAKVRADKLREVEAGHDGTWVAHPALVPVARKIFKEHMPGPNQLSVIPKSAPITAADLLTVPDGQRTLNGLRSDIRICMQYLEAWLRGEGCVPLNHLMEDSATAEISRSLVWQWTHHRVTLSNGRRVTPHLVYEIMQDELQRMVNGTTEPAHNSERYVFTSILFYQLIIHQQFTEFLTLPAYAQLEQFASEEEIPMISVDTISREQSLNNRWGRIVRNYTPEDVARLRGTVRIEYTLARMGAERLWQLLHTVPYVQSLGALTGNQALQMVRAGLPAIYVSGWQVAADANDAGQMYPDQSLYPVDSVPALVRRINNAFQRADQIHHSKAMNHINWFAPIIADAEAGFGGILNAFELMKAMIEAGAAAVHFEDQLSAVKKCGHLGGKVLVPTGEFIQKLLAARLAADILDVPTILIARTDANSALCVTSDADARDREFISGERTPEGFFKIRGGLEAAIARALAYAPYADMIWCETSAPDLDEARIFAEAVHAKFPGKLLAYNCSPSFNWKKKLSDATIAHFQSELGTMGYKYQFITLAGFHSLNHAMYELASAYRTSGMTAYADFQAQEFIDEEAGYEATRHQQFVGTGYFDEITTLVTGGTTSTLAMEGSTEQQQFHSIAS